MFFLQSDPIVVEVVKQPPITPEISYGSVLLSAVGVIGILFFGGILVGVLLGCAIVWRKRKHEATDPVDHSHIKLRLG